MTPPDPPHPPHEPEGELRTNITTCMPEPGKDEAEADAWARTPDIGTGSGHNGREKKTAMLERKHDLLLDSCRFGNA